jgi:hypothetical protein
VLRRFAATPVLVAAALVAAALFALAGCSHGDGYRGGSYAGFTFRPAAPTPSPRPTSPPSHPSPTAQTLPHWIAGDREQLRRLPRTSPAYTGYEADLMNALYLAHRDAELEHELAFVRATLPGAAEPARDASFLRGDRTAGFDAYAVGDLRDPLALAHAARWNDAIAVLRAVREGPGFPGRSIAAALLEGDAYAACGSYDAARTTWYRAFSTAVLRGNDRHRFFPEWTSAMNRLVHERGVVVRASSAPGCRELPPPLADPVS